MFRDYLQKIIDRKNLSEPEMSEMIEEIFSGKLSNAQIGAFMAVRHLIELGHRDIAIIGGKPETRLYSPIGKERLARSPHRRGFGRAHFIQRCA